MTDKDLDEFFQIVDDVIKYGSLEERFGKKEFDYLAKQCKDETYNEPTVEEIEEFHRKLNRQYWL